MKKRHGTYVLWFGLLHAAELLFLFYWYVFTDGFPSFIQGHPKENVIIPMASFGFVGILFGSMIRDIAKD